MAKLVRIPTVNRAARFSITLAGRLLRLRLTYNTADDAGWVLDIGDQAGAVLIAGIPLITGTDLLGQHTSLRLDGALFVLTDRSTDEVPTYAGLGSTSHLYFVTAD